MKNVIKAMFTDKSWDADGCKITGFIVVVFGCVLCALKNEMGMQLVWCGGAMIAGKAIRENE